MAICLSAGITFQFFVGGNHLVLASLILAFLIFTALVTNGFKNPVLLGIVFSLILFFLGFIRMDLKENHIPKNHFDNNTQVLIGIVEQEITRKNKIKTCLNIEYQLEKDSSFRKAFGRLLIYLDADEASQKLIPGDRILFQSNIQSIPENRNPHAFNYQSFLHLKGIDHQAFIKPENWQLLNRNNLNRLRHLTFNIRHQLLKVLRQNIRSSEEFSICAALVLGYRNELSKTLYKTYQETGAVHVLAVSGLHLGILTQILFLVFGLIPSDKRAIEICKALAIVVLIWLFALVTGAAPAVLRAATMFTFFIIGKTLFKDVNTYNILAASAILLLLYDPFLLFQVGFQLSYCALLSIIYFHPIISNWWIPKNKVLFYVWNLSVVSIAAQILVFPITTYYFHQFPLYFILSGLVAVPMATIILSLSIGLFLFHFSLPFFNEGISPVLNQTLEGFLWSMRQIQVFPYCSLSEILIRSTDVIIIYFLLLNVIIWINTQNRKMIFPFLVGICFLILSNVIYLNTSLKQKEFIVYETNKGFVLDLFTGQKGLEIKSADISETTLQFATDGNRLHKNISVKTDRIKTDSLSSGNIQLKSGLLSVDNKSILWAPNEITIPKNHRLKIDYLIVGDLEENELTNLLTNVQCEKLILSNEAKYWTRNKIKESLVSKNISFHSIEEDGPFIQEL